MAQTATQWLRKEVSKLGTRSRFYHDVISSFVCGHPPKQTYLNDGVWHCENCGGKWNSIAKN